MATFGTASELTWLSGCPVCGATRAAHHQVRGSVRLLRCLDCGVAFSNPQPRGVVDEKYDERYDLGSYFGALEPRKRVLFQRRLERVPEPTPRRDRLIDVGCGDGQFLELARSVGWRPTGLDANPSGVAAARERGLDVVLGRLESKEDLSWGTFHLVTCWDVLEHTPEPRAFARALTRLLAPGGTLVLTTLNRRSLVAMTFGSRWSMVCEDHFTYWTRSSLRRLFAESGLQVVDTDVFGIGRDFVAWRDRIAGRRMRPEHDEVSRPGSRWDVKPGVLRAETALNRVFRILGGGVGIGITLRRPT